MTKARRKSDFCLNCNTPVRDYNYCPNCGQMNTSKQIPLRLFLTDILSDFFTFDSRFFRSFVPLLKKPGHLTNEYNSGRRVSYILPLRLYLFTTFFFFLILSLYGKLNDNLSDQTTRAVYANRDSLKTIFQKYDAVLSPDAASLIMDDITAHYTLKVKSPGKYFAYRDSVERVLGSLTRQLPNEQRYALLNALFYTFTFIPGKTNGSSGQSREQLRHFFDSRPEAAGLQNVDQLVDALAIRYSIIPRRAGASRPKPHVKVLWTDKDSLNNKYLLRFAEKLERLGQAGDAGGQLLLREMLNQLPKVMFLVLPLFALLLKLLYFRQGIFYVNHLIFSLHAHTVAFIFLIFAVLFPEWYVILLVAVAIGLHWFLSMRAVYKQSALMTFAKLSALIVLYQIPLVLGFTVLTVLAVLNT